MKLSVSYANHLLMLIRKRGDYSLEDLNLDINETVLENESNLLCYSQIVPLIKKLQDLYPNKCAGIYAGHNQTLSSWGRAGFAILTCKTLYDAISLGMKYHRATAMLVHLDFKFIQNNHSEVTIEKLDSNEALLPFCFESTIASLLSIYTQLTGNSIDLLKIDLEYNLDNSSKLEYQNYFECPVKLNCKETRVHFALPKNTNMPMFDAANSKMFLQQVIERNNEIKSDSLASQVLQLTSKGDGRFYSQSEMASELSISTSCLAKKLNKAGTSYREILESSKQSIAIKHLKTSPSMKMYEIAILSGYSDISNFRKAFLRWEGMAPSDYRKSHNI
jgi:AraC-like DNA-binding protein